MGSIPAAAVYTASLPIGDGHASDSPVADTEDLLGVRGDNQVDVVGAGAKILEGDVDAVWIVDAQVNAPRALELLDCSVRSPPPPWACTRSEASRRDAR